MEVCLLIMVVLLAVTSSMQGLMAAISEDEMALKQRLRLINKPAIKSFKTKHGDILDCVEINKQLAFDHPLLKNHSIQMKPSINKSKWRRLNDRSSLELTPSQLLPKNMRCPEGTVPIKRIREQDLAMAQKYAPLLGMPSSNNPLPEGHHVANLGLYTRNFGVYGSINVWTPSILHDQFSSGSVFVASEYSSAINGIIAGWMVNEFLYENYTRLYTYWTRDSGKNTGCFNTICPGFVQVSQEIPLGLIIRPISIDGGNQYYIQVSIEQDTKTKSWWLFFGRKEVGYWPKELFSTLKDGAARGGWGGEVYSPVKEATPSMGSGHFPDEGFKKACFIADLQFINSAGSANSPSIDDLRYERSNPDCYKVSYKGDAGGFWGHYMFFGGPPNCML